MAIKVFHRIRDLREALAHTWATRVCDHENEDVHVGESPMFAHATGCPIGLVPTMGALHRGHGSLISRSALDQRPSGGLTVVSVFVNPIQFEDQYDLDSYPDTPDSDLTLCEEAGADIVFAPSVNEMYPQGFSTFVDAEGEFLTKLCGAARPGHFRGVLTVVSKLFHIVQPTRAYFGEKDAQQLFAIKKMARDLDMDIQVIGCPTVRDGDGLALSSRNSRLSAREREEARCLHRALEEGCSALVENRVGPPRSALEKTISAPKKNQSEYHGHAARYPDDVVASAKKIMATTIEAESSARLDYADILDADTFECVTRNTRKTILAVAAYFGETRLIDNMSVDLDVEKETDGLR
jgi:pantoate--beta-alanine ligase